MILINKLNFFNHTMAEFNNKAANQTPIKLKILTLMVYRGESQMKKVSSIILNWIKVRIIKKLQSKIPTLNIF